MRYTSPEERNPRSVFRVLAKLYKGLFAFLSGIWVLDSAYQVGVPATPRHTEDFDVREISSDAVVNR
jgi:hypothetical protein